MGLRSKEVSEPVGQYMVNWQQRPVVMAPVLWILCGYSHRGIMILYVRITLAVGCVSSGRQADHEKPPG